MQINDLKFRLLSDNAIPWGKIERCYDSTPYKKEKWANFLFNTQKVKPWVVEITYGNNHILGWFYAQRIKRFGIPMVVSPIEGWTTSYQGLSLKKEITTSERVELYENLIQWLFRNNHCWYVQVSDWQLELEEVKNRFYYDVLLGYRLTLKKDFETEIYKNFKEKSAKYSIKKARKSGIEIRHAYDANSFAENYFTQLVEVFGRQGLKPTYSKSRIIELCKALTPDRDILLLEAYLPKSEKCIATGLFLKDENLAIYFGAASFGEYQKLCPNELLMNDAIKWLNEQGVKEMEFGGGRKYKEKYGPIPFQKPKIMVAKYPILITMKRLAKKSYYGMPRSYLRR